MFSTNLVNNFNDYNISLNKQLNTAYERPNESYINRSQQVGSDGQKNLLVFNLRCKGNINSLRGM